MKILHYALGFPTYRTGGLTKFCIDLMNQQLLEGHEVALMWPGEMRLNYRNTCIRNRGLVNGIQSWEIINPTPMSYDEGITAFARFTEDGDIKCYRNFFQRNQIDVLHLHTFMGIHRNLLKAAKERNVRIVYTSHDFFAICPTVTLFRDGKACDSVESCSHCPSCNKSALPIWKIMLLQTKLYRTLKDAKMVAYFRKRHRESYLGKTDKLTKAANYEESREYLRMREHFASMMNMVDVIHYNSTVTKSVYERTFGERNSITIPLSHSEIHNHKVERKYSDGKVRIGYLGPRGRAKGFLMLKEALDELWKERQNFSLDVYFAMDDGSPYINTHNIYTYGELETVFNSMDVLIVPSLLYETFSFVALEALSYGVPVIVTKNVGAKDLLVGETGIVIEDLSVQSLKNTFRSLSAEQLRRMNQNIVENVNIPSISDVSLRIMKECYLV